MSHPAMHPKPIISCPDLPATHRPRNWARKWSTPLQCRAFSAPQGGPARFQHRWQHRQRPFSRASELKIGCRGCWPSGEGGQGLQAGCQPQQQPVLAG
eukprot:scaffold282306_cov48-Prasinocladus_malaysianus.AAC.2